jgi:hypothetical protein
LIIYDSQDLCPRTFTGRGGTKPQAGRMTAFCPTSWPEAARDPGPSPRRGALGKVPRSPPGPPLHPGGGPLEGRGRPSHKRAPPIGCRESLSKTSLYRGAKPQRGKPHRPRQLGWDGGRGHGSSSGAPVPSAPSPCARRPPPRRAPRSCGPSASGEQQTKHHTGDGYAFGSQQDEGHSNACWFLAMRSVAPLHPELIFLRPGTQSLHSHGCVCLALSSKAGFQKHIHVLARGL